MKETKVKKNKDLLNLDETKNKSEDELNDDNIFFRKKVQFE